MKETGLFKQGSKMSAFVEKFKYGGKNVCDIQKYQAGGNFYKNWSKGDIVKLQQFLSRDDMLGDDAYQGEFDGIMGPQTIAAIKAYQKKQGVTADGMWGTNTNKHHKVITSGIVSKSPYSNSHRYEAGNFVTYDVAGKPMKENDYYKAINNLKERFYADPEAFWSDNGEMAKWREHLYKTPQGTAIMEEFYSATPEDIRQRINPKKLNTKMQQADMNSGIREATGNVADFVTTKALPAIALPLSAVAAPVATVGAVVGGLAGSKIGSNLWRNANSGEERYNYMVTDDMGNEIPVVRDPEQVREAQGGLVGGAIGAALGGIGAEYIEMPTETPQGYGYRRTNNSAPRRTGRSQHKGGNKNYETGRGGSYDHSGQVRGKERVRWADGPNKGRFAKTKNPGLSEKTLDYIEGVGGNPETITTLSTGNPSYQWYGPGLKFGGKIR